VRVIAAKPAKKSVALSGVVVAETAICSIDPEQGILRYRGYDITDLAEQSTYEEVAYLLLEGELPTEEELRAFEQELSQRELPANARTLIDGNAHDVTPMEMLRTAASLLSFADPAEAVERTVRLAPRCYQPDPRTRDVYAERYAQYRALYDGTEGALA